MIGMMCLFIKTKIAVFLFSTNCNYGLFRMKEVVFMQNLFFGNYFRFFFLTTQCSFLDYSLL